MNERGPFVPLRQIALRLGWSTRHLRDVLRGSPAVLVVRGRFYTSRALLLVHAPGVASLLDQTVATTQEVADKTGLDPRRVREGARGKSGAVKIGGRWYFGPQVLEHAKEAAMNGDPPGRRRPRGHGRYGRRK